VTERKTEMLRHGLVYNKEVHNFDFITHREKKIGGL
jgi:hypothetical protein